MVGQRGPCVGCGETVTIFPPVQQLAPPQPIRSGLMGALFWGVLAFILILSLRSIPFWVSVNRSANLTRNHIIPELAALAGVAALVAFLGGCAHFLAAALAITERSHATIQRSMRIGMAVGLVVGIFIAILLNWRYPSVAFYPHGETISLAMLAGMAAGMTFGGAIGLPIASHREKRLVQKAVFTAPPPEVAAAPQADFVLADVTPPAPVEPRPEITSQRRQELIRRLGIVHEEDKDDAATELDEPDET